MKDNESVNGVYKDNKQKEKYMRLEEEMNTLIANTKKE